MRGHITQRSKGSWRLVVDAGTDPITKKRRQVTRTIRGTKRQAQDALTDLILEVRKGRHGGAELTVGEVIDRWLEHAKPTLSPKTYEDYQGIIRRHITPSTLHDAALRKLGAADLDRYDAGLREHGVGAATRRKIHNLVRRALTQAVRWEWIDTNPAMNAERPQVTKVERQPPDPAQLAKLIAAATAGEDHDFATLLRVAAVTGARRGELCALRWSDLQIADDLADFELARFKAAGRTPPPGVMTINRSVVAVTGQLVEKSTKTEDVRRLALDEGTVAALAAHRVRTGERLLACGVGLEPSSYIFPAELDGRAPSRPDVISHRFVRLCRAAGVTGIRFHDIRHYVATRMFELGVDVRTTMGRLGHSQMATTQGYAHLVAEADQVAADKLGGLLDGKAAG
jgi:integrase